MSSIKKMLVTGGAGFIGSNFVNKYRGIYDIYIVDLLTYAGNIGNLDSEAFRLSQNPRNFYRMNIANFNEMDKLFHQIKPDIVVNFAAESHVDRSINDSLVFTSTNVYGTHVLLELSVKYSVEKYVQVSTDEVYGHLGVDDPPFTELTPLNPRSPYSATKASADLLVNAYHNTHGLNTCITRCSNNFGKNQHVEKFLPKIITNALINKPIPIYGNGDNVRDWIYVEDHISGIHLVIEKGKPGEIYNFGGIYSEMSNNQLCKNVLDIMGKSTDLIEYVIDRKGHDFRYAVDFSKSSRELGWVPTHDFISSLEKTIYFYTKLYLKQQP